MIRLQASGRPQNNPIMVLGTPRDSWTAGRTSPHLKTQPRQAAQFGRESCNSAKHQEAEPAGKFHSFYYRLSCRLDPILSTPSCEGRTDSSVENPFQMHWRADPVNQSANVLSQTCSLVYTSQQCASQPQPGILMTRL